MPDRFARTLGFEIHVDGIPRTFRDRKEPAIAAAHYLKSKGRSDIVKVVDCATGAEMLMLPDGRLG
jgi:hypothetical protein